MTRIKAVAFDLDGTLLDHVGASRQGLAHLVQQRGGTNSPELKWAWEDAERRHFEAWRSGAVTFAEQRRLRLRDFLPLLDGQRRQQNDVELDSIFDTYLAGYEAAWATFPEVAEVLDAVRGAGLSIGLLTNGNHEQQLKKLAAVEIERAFDVICTSESLGVAKPHPDAYNALCSKLGVDATEVLYVGDDYLKDVRGARDAGLQALFIDRDGSSEAEERGHRDLRGLIPLLPARRHVI